MPGICARATATSSQSAGAWRTTSRPMSPVAPVSRIRIAREGIGTIGGARPFMTYPDPGSLLRDARRRHRGSQTALARRAGTSARHIGRIERGEVSPSVDTVQRLLACMGERLELTVADGPSDNRSDADVRE